MTPPAVVAAFALTGEIPASALCGCTCDLDPKCRRPRSSTQLSQRDTTTRLSTDTFAAARKQYQRHKPNYPNHHDTPMSRTRRTRRLADTKRSRFYRKIRDAPTCLAQIPDMSMNTMKAIGQTQSISTYSTRHRSHGQASRISCYRKDENEVPSGPLQIDENIGARAHLRSRIIHSILKANPSPSNCVMAAPNDLLSPHAPAPLGGVCADTSHEDVSLHLWLWLILPLEIWKGVLNLHTAVVSLILLYGIIIRQRPRGCPSVNQTTWLTKEENSKPEMSHGSESRILGETSSHKGQSSTKGKRQAKENSQRRDDGHDGEDDDDDDGGDGPRGNPPKRMRSEAHYKRFACPFLKHNPRKYESEKSCVGPGWPSIHRLKEHIYRRHQLPKHCDRCQETFTTMAEMLHHLEQPIQCDIVEKTVVDGINHEQLRRLRSRRKGMASDEEKWRDIYKIIFPDDEIPSNPYYTHEDTSPAIPKGLTALRQLILDAIPKGFEEYAAQLDPIQMEQVVSPFTSALQHGLAAVSKGGSSSHGQTTKYVHGRQTQPVADQYALYGTNPQDHALLNSTGPGQSPLEFWNWKRKSEDSRGQASNNNNNSDAGGIHNDRQDKYDFWPLDDGKDKQRHSEEERQPDNFWACPFYKLDPFRHYRCLEKTKLKRFADVKQHMSRAHVVGDACPNCWARFKDGVEVDSHTRVHICRHVRDRQEIAADNLVLHSLVPEELKLLNEIPRSASEADKWYWMWDQLFGEHPRPASPFVMEGIAEPMALLARHGETRLQAKLPALLQACDQSDQQSVSRLGKEITRIFSNLSPPVSQPFFRKFPPEDTYAGTAGAGSKSSTPIEMPSSLRNTSVIAQLDTELSEIQTISLQGVGFGMTEALATDYPSHEFLPPSDSSREMLFNFTGSFDTYFPGNLPEDQWFDPEILGDSHLKAPSNSGT